jgi:hypothetical protein
LWWELRALAVPRAPLFAALAFAAAALTIAPWPARNLYWSVTTGEPFYVFQPLGSRAPYTKMYTPGFLAWLRSHEEPFVWSAWDQPPARPYLDDDERRQVRALFDEMRARDGEVTPDMNRRFQKVADERLHKAPLRVIVWRRLTSAAKYWLSPRLSTIDRTVTGSPGAPSTPLWLLALFCLMSWATTALAALGLLVDRTRALVYPAAILACATIILVEVGLGEARYLMPLFGIVCVLAGRGVDVARALARRRK